MGETHAPAQPAADSVVGSLAAHLSGLCTPLGDPQVLLHMLGSAAVASIATALFCSYSHSKKDRKRIKDDLYREFLRSNAGSNPTSDTNTTTGSHTSDGPKGVGGKGERSSESGPIAGFQASEDLVREQLARNYAFLGEEGMSRVRGAYVVVVGLGGVGSHAAHMLARSGAGRIRVVDFDQVSLSSLNRHAVAQLDDVGTPKTECLRSHLQRLAPHVKVDPMNKLFNIDVASNVLLGGGKPDYVLDCIDNIDTKVDLLKFCVDNNIKVVSSMGSGAKSDSSRVQIADISETFEDPLARRTRRGLKLKGVEKGVTVVYSTEKPGDVALLPLEEDKYKHAKEYSALPDFRVRILPVLGTLPAIFGCCMASYVVTELAGFPTEPLPVRTREKTHAKVHRELLNREKNFFRNEAFVPLNIQDVGFILDEIWRGRSALSKTFDRLVLTRWDTTKPLGFGNAIALTFGEARKHDEMKPEQLRAEYGDEFVDFVEARFKKEAKLNAYRL